MPETKLILILANSVRLGKCCVAGKFVARLGDGSFDISGQWIRLSDPREAEGAVPFTNTICRNHGPVRPLDIINVGLRGHCANPDHPEDWYFEPDQPWEFVANIDSRSLPEISDNPQSLWHDGFESKSVSAGFVRAMGKNAISLCLVKAPESFEISYYKEFNSFKGFDRKIRKLEFRLAGKTHEFSVTDPHFDRRFKLPGAVSQWPDRPTMLTVPHPANVFFCLSLTSEFKCKQYKICATIFEWI